MPHIKTEEDMAGINVWKIGKCGRFIATSTFQVSDYIIKTQTFTRVIHYMGRSAAWPHDGVMNFLHKTIYGVYAGSGPFDCEGMMPPARPCITHVITRSLLFGCPECIDCLTTLGEELHAFTDRVQS